MYPNIIQSLFVSLLCLASLFSPAQTSLLFKVEHPKWKTHSYVFGTMHVNDPKAFGFGNAVFDAIDASEIAAFELNMSNKSQQGIRSDIGSDSTFMAALEKLKVEFPKKLKEAGISQEELVSKGGSVYAEAMKKMINPTSGNENRLEAMDMFLQSYATHKGKEVIGIETVQEQLKYILNFNLDVAMDSIIGFLKTPDWDLKITEYLNSTDKLQTIYTGMALNGICDEVNKTPLTPWLNDLIYKRNDIMIERTFPLMEKHALFIAVGAAHLCGGKGLLQLLKQMGCKVTPVKIGGETDVPAIVWKNNTVLNEVEVETANVLLALETTDILYDETETTFKASDTARIGLIHFEVRKGMDQDALEIAISPGQEIPEEGVAIEEAAPVETPYGEDHIGEAIFEGEDAEIETESNSELAALMAAKLGEAFKVNTADTILMNGAMGEFQVLKQVKYGTLIYTASFVDPKNADYIWKLKLYGDPDWMNNQDIMRFFTSFKFKD
jgi:uncharacterized protein YbaP (TraB family)